MSVLETHTYALNMSPTLIYFQQCAILPQLAQQKKHTLIHHSYQELWNDGLYPKILQSNGSAREETHPHEHAWEEEARGITKDGKM